MENRPDQQIALTIYCARTGDHNDRAMRGAVVVGEALSRRLSIHASTIGTPEPAVNAEWEQELAAARPALSGLAGHLDNLFNGGLVPLCALSRCAASLATLPILMRHHPDALVVWLDAHPDLNTPQTTLTGYLGGMSLAGPAGLWDSGLGNGLSLSNIVLVGARDLDPAEQALVDESGVKLIPPGDDALEQLRDVIAGRAIYIHLDCDVLEPNIVPTDYRVPGGFSLDELHAICQVLAEAELIGLEIAEFEYAGSENSGAVSPNALLDALDPVVSRLGKTWRQ